MALMKEIRQPDGVVTKYHRILYLKATVNRQNSIAVLSYVDDTVREDEKNNLIEQPYCASNTYETGYDEQMNIITAYEWLKSQPEYEGAEDI